MMESKKSLNDIYLREHLAYLQHEIWSHWMKYLFSTCSFVGEQGSEDSMFIRGDLVERWTRQLQTPYSDLSEEEKDRKREQADSLLDYLYKVNYLDLLDALDEYREIKDKTT